MTEGIYEYTGIVGLLHVWRNNLSERWLQWHENNPEGFLKVMKKKICFSSNNSQDENFSHIYRRKTRIELIRLSTAVMGIEFAYAAETAFVSPILLKIGVEHRHMTLVWALSPLIGLLLTPILGSLSDRCSLKFGRRRPFILLLAFGVLLGLILVPNGENLGYEFGDLKPNITLEKSSSFRTSAIIFDEFIPYHNDIRDNNKIYHPWGVFFTILGTILLDFDADACQSPARAYLLDVLVKADHAKGLSTFTIMAGLGGFMGYALGGINWDETSFGIALGGHVKAVFTLITVIFVFCVVFTVTSFKEIPLALLETYGNIYHDGEESQTPKSEEKNFASSGKETYGSLVNRGISSEKDGGEYIGLEDLTKADTQNSVDVSSTPSLSLYVSSIFNLPWSLVILCITNFFCWMAHVCYSLYFTDFVGESVFNGDPTAPEGSASRQLYDEGVRFGCWGMSMYSLSCACYSMIIEKFIKRFGARNVYIGGPLFYSAGMLLMALTRNKFGVILFSGAAGIMYSTLFTMPYLLVAHYHSKGVFTLTADGEPEYGNQMRGLGTDVAVVSSMVFLAQFMLSFWMGTIVSLSGTTTAVVAAASILALIGSLCATKVMYFDL